MPPPSLSTTTIVQIDAAVGRRPSRALASCRKATSPISSAVGRCAAAASATPTAVDTTPSMPLAPRLASTRSAGRAGRRTTRRRGPASTTTRPGPRRRAARATTSRATAGSVGSGWPAERPRRWRPRGVGVRPLATASHGRAGRPVGAARLDGGRTAPAGRGRIRDRDAPAVAVGVGATPSASTPTCRASGRGQPLVDDLRCRRRAQPHDDLGREAGGDADRRKMASACDDRRRRRHPAAAAGIGQHRPAQSRAASACTASASSIAAAGDDHAPVGRARRRPARRRSPSARRAATTRCHGAPPSRPGGSAPRLADAAARGTAG